jgi:hypothetical protein
MPALEVEMRLRVPLLPQALYYDRTYQWADFWQAFLAMQNEVWWSIREVRDFELGEGYDDLVTTTDEEQAEDYEDDASAAAVKQETLVPEDHEEAVAIARVIEQWKGEEEANYSWDGLSEPVRLTVRVA